jgi:hypothetical protein
VRPASWGAERKGDLANFKKFIEARGTESGARRGDVRRDPRVGEPARPPA